MTATPITPPPVPRKINPHWPLRFAIVGTSFLIYVIACATPAIYWSTQGKITSMPGIGGLAAGWCAILYGNFAWCANLLLAAAALFLILAFWRTSIILSLLAATMALQTYMLLSLPLPANEGDTEKMTATSFGIGFYFWLASMLIACLGAWWLKHKSKPQSTLIPVRAFSGD